MKYNIQINQLVLQETELDLADCAILDYLYTLCSSRNGKIDQYRKNGFTWLDYGHLLKEMPLLRIKSRGALVPRFERIKNAGYIEIFKEEGHKLYVKLTPKIDTLFFNSVHETERQRSPNETPSVHETEPIIVISNNTIKLKADFEIFWKAYPRKVSKKKSEQIWLRLKPDEATLEQILQAIKFQAKSDQWQKDDGKFIPHPTTWLNAERWNDEMPKKETIPVIVARPLPQGYKEPVQERKISEAGQKALADMRAKFGRKHQMQ